MASNSNGNGHSPNGNGHAGGNGAAGGNGSPSGNGHAEPAATKPAPGPHGGKSTKANCVTKPGVLGVPPRRPKINPADKSGRVREYQPSTFELEVYYHVTSGKTYKEVAALLGVAYITIFRITKKIDTWLAPQYMEAIRELKANHVERLMHIYHEAMAAWERSKNPIDSVTVKDVVVKSQDAAAPKEPVAGELETTAKPARPANAKEITRNRRWQTGVPAYLDQAREALADIRRILGADAPLKVEHSGEIRVAGQQLTEIVAQAKQRLGESMYRLSALAKSSPN